MSSDTGFRYDLADKTVLRIIERFSPDKVVVYGSVARGVADEHSDLDLLVVMETDEPYFEFVSGIVLAVSDIDVAKDIMMISTEEFDRTWDNPYSYAGQIMRTGRIVYDAVSGTYAGI
ncbi:MAG: nucleotidyltransferase domain-containing protein [Candidatus Methanomethylophilaceae archaeon]|nr:nucleotidyltransferase domain-containing protein [Candidatus Methanomethylophilaceae archaeon]